MGPLYYFLTAYEYTIIHIQNKRAHTWWSHFYQICTLIDNHIISYINREMSGNINKKRVIVVISVGEMMGDFSISSYVHALPKFFQWACYTMKVKKKKIKSIFIMKKEK